MIMPGGLPPGIFFLFLSDGKNKIRYQWIEIIKTMSENRLVDNGDGTVTDALTQLMWMQNDSYLDLMKFVSYRAALKYLHNKNAESFAGYNDWRLPHKREAHSLFDRDKFLEE